MSPAVKARALAALGMGFRLMHQGVGGDWAHLVAKKFRVTKGEVLRWLAMLEGDPELETLKASVSDDASIAWTARMTKVYAATRRRSR